MPYKLIGRQTNFSGKTLWEIIGNLKNFGVGRTVVRSVFERYPEPSYLKILKVETLPESIAPSTDNVRKVKVTVEKTFRGQKLATPVILESTSYKADYKLLSKDEEAAYCKTEAVKQFDKVLPRTMEFPPVLKELLLREMKSKGEDCSKEPKLNIVYNKMSSRFKYRIAEEGEKATVEFTMGLGTPASPNLYKGVL